MISITDKKTCCGCEACSQACPKQCISLVADNEGFSYPIVNKSECITCGICEKVCPELKVSHKRKPINVFAAINPDENIRLSSSSGGIFSMLAEQTFAQGGTVFGASFDLDWSVRHIETTNSMQLARLRGSKYLQSHIGNIYRLVRQRLVNGQHVLFSGTPCQVSGLRNYLQKDYGELLLLVDFVCHGVPSPLIWKSYLTSNYPIHEIKSVSFRSKSDGWKNFCMNMTLHAEISDSCRSIPNNGQYSVKNISESFRSNPFMQSFLSNINIRPSCYTCSFKCGTSGSDITLGDFWGIDKINPEIDDDKGVSLIAVNTAKGQSRAMNLGIKLISESYESAAKYNPSIEQPVCIPPYRSLFMAKFTKSGFKEAYASVFSKSMLARIKRRIWLQLHKHDI